MKNEHVQMIMTMISHSGKSKSLVFEALSLARKGKYDDVERLMNEAKEELMIGHKSHTDLLFSESQNNDITVTLLLIHAADHMNSAETTMDLAEELIEFIKECRND